MKIRMQIMAKGLALVAALGAASGASAQAAGEWTAKVGLNKITPKVDSGFVSAPALPGTQADVGSDTQPIFAFARGITDNISAEIDLGVPYKHTLYGAGAIEGTGPLGTSEVLPPTAFLQYRFFKPDALFRPYVGLGLTYAYFRHETGSGQMTAILNTGGPAATYSLESKFAASAQVGATMRINELWFLDVAVVKTRLKTRATFSTGQTQDIRLDPLAVSFGIGYRFK